MQKPNGSEYVQRRFTPFEEKQILREESKLKSKNINSKENKNLVWKGKEITI